MISERTWSSAISVLAAAMLVVGIGCGDNGGEEGDTGEQTEDTATADMMSEDTGTMPEDTGTDEDTGTEDDTGGDDTGMDTSEDDTGEMDAGDTGGECSFFPNDCADGEHCLPTQQGRQCAPFNSDNAEGDMCQGGNDCDEGLVCSPQTNSCRELCDPNDLDNFGCSTAERSCLQGADQQGNLLDYGICLPTCEPWPNDSCPEAQNCYPNPTVSGDNVCLTFNPNNEKGDSCQGLTDCDDDLLCNPNSNTCAEKCNDDNPCQGDSETCQMAQQLPYGICVSQ